MSNVYEIVTANIIKELEKGNIPWLKPWDSVANAPRNFLSNKPYRGANVFILAARGFSSPYWLTFKQARSKGGTVRKDEKGTPIIFWKFTKEKDCDGKEIQKAMLRYYMVFNAAQTDGIEYPEPKERAEFAPLEACEKVVVNMPNPPVINHGVTAAYYMPSRDVVELPNKEDFKSPSAYYATLFHELAHSTGHKSRLDRVGVTTKGLHKTREEYSKEELIAEFTAAFLCGNTGILTHTVENTAAYIKNWVKVLKDDSRVLISAGSQAQKAADYILNNQEG